MTQPKPTPDDSLKHSGGAAARQVPPRAPAPPFRERRWAILIHGLIVVAALPLLLATPNWYETSPYARYLLILPFLPMAASYALYLVNRRKNEYLAFHGLQASVLQLLVVALTIFLGTTMLLIGAVYALTGVLFTAIGWEFKYLLAGHIAAWMIARLRR